MALLISGYCETLKHQNDLSKATPLTYIPTWAGLLYLVVVLGTFSRRIVGWAMETHLRTELVLQSAQPGPLAAPPERGDSSFRPG
jgi:hypothetical protein